jgi:hypothetical protein
MTRLASITIAVFLTALWSSQAPAQGKQLCNPAAPSSPQGHWWSYRIIDGRKCWYEGKPGLSKSLLQWPQEMPSQPAQEEARRTGPQRPRDPLESRAWAPNAQPPADPETFGERWRVIERGSFAEEAASVSDGPVTLDEDGKPPLAKADRLPLPPLAGSWAKMKPCLLQEVIPAEGFQPERVPGPTDQIELGSHHRSLKDCEVTTHPSGE